MGETLWVPLTPPGLKLVPLQEVAFVEDQVRVEEPPEVIEVGLAVRDTVGAAALTVTVAEALALPPAPVHVTE